MNLDSMGGKIKSPSILASPACRTKTSCFLRKSGKRWSLWAFALTSATGRKLTRQGDFLADLAASLQRFLKLAPLYHSSQYSTTSPSRKQNSVKACERK